MARADSKSVTDDRLVYGLGTQHRMTLYYVCFRIVTVSD